MVLETIYETLGFVVFWTVFLIAAVSIVGVFMIKTYVRWRDFWVAKSNEQWDGYKEGGDIPPKENLKKSWRYLQIAYPYKNGLKGASMKEHMESWQNRREEKKNTG